MLQLPEATDLGRLLKMYTVDNDQCINANKPHAERRDLQAPRVSETTSIDPMMHRKFGEASSSQISVAYHPCHALCGSTA
jgi:hypothetical protein